jgi:small subunit ribosomal protein S8
MQDPLADMLTRVRNAHMAAQESVTMPASKMKVSIAKVLKDEGYVNDFSVSEGIKPELNIIFKYLDGKPVIEKIDRVSKPSLRVYNSKSSLPSIEGGLGIAVISTSHGVMTDRAARTAGIGGEVICTVF